MRVLLIGVGTLCLAAQGLLAQPVLFSNSSKGTQGQTASAATGGRVRQVNADAQLLRDSELIGFNLFDDRNLTVRKTRETSDGVATVWSGEVLGTTGSEVTLILEGARITGHIRTTDGEFYRIRPGADGLHSIEQVVLGQVVTEDVALEAPEELLVDEAKAAVRGAEAAAGDGAMAGATSLVDIMVLYTAEARAAAGSTADIESRIRLAIAETNQAFTNSGVAMQLRLVYTGEAAPSAGQAANNSYLSLVTSNGAIRTLRDQYGADMVSVWVSGPGSGGGVVGIGWVMNRPSTTFQSAAFNVEELNFANAPYYSFGHEVGHNLGGSHDRANSSAPGAFSYAYGLQQPSGRFVSMMAYTGNCAGCSRIPYYSNPEVTYNGYPTGIVSTAADSADMRLTINATRSFAEQFRATVVPVTPSAPPPPTPAPTPVSYKPAVNSLAPSAGTGTSVTYTVAYSDDNGAADIRSVLLSVQGAAVANGCLVTVDRPTGAVVLRNDSDTGWISGLTLGQASTLSNSQCTISGTGAALTASGNGVTLVLPVAFKPLFAGTRDVWAKVEDMGGLYPSWQKLGTWTIPVTVAPPTPPSFTSLSPNSGSGRSATFNAVFSDPNGAADITRAVVVINNVLSSSGGCYLYVMADSQRYYMLTAAGTAWLGPALFGQAGLSNGNCTIGSGSALNKSGTTMSLSLPVQFGTSFSGSKYVYVTVGDTSGLKGWTTAGTFNIQ
jgi:peptidyl-Asp metalloendopeptidase